MYFLIFICSKVQQSCFIAALPAVLIFGCATSHEKRIAYHYEPTYGVASLKFERALVAGGAACSVVTKLYCCRMAALFFSSILEAIRGASSTCDDRGGTWPVANRLP
jgi:hypothetical protein